MAASGLPSPSRSTQAKPRRPEIPANGWIVVNVPSPLFLRTSGGPWMRAQQDVHIPIGLDIDGPGTGVGGMEQCRGQLGLGGYVGKGCWALLAQEANAAFASQYQVGFEVVIEVDGQDGLGLKRRIRGSSGKRKLCTRRQLYAVAVGYGDHRSARAAERDSSDPGPRAPCRRGLDR